MIIILFGIVVVSYSQPLSFNLKQISTNEGLPASTVRYIEEDKNGFIWLGIEAMGVCRYDGRNFLYFRFDPENPYSLSNDYITSIFCDDSNTVWVGTENGLNRYNEEDGNFIRYSYKGKSNHVKDYRINIIIQNEQGDIILGSDRGLEVSNPSTYKLELVFPFHVVRDSSLPDIKVNAILQEDENSYWLGTRNGLYYVDMKEKTFECFYNDFPLDNNHVDWIHAMCFRNDNRNIYIATHSGLFEFDKSRQKFTLINLDLIDRGDIILAGFSNIINDEGILWLSSFNKGVIVVDPNQKNDKLIEFNKHINEVIKSQSIRHIHKTRAGQILIATRFEGLYVYDKKQLTFPHWTKTEENGLSDNYVISVWEDSNYTIWIGTKSNGLNRYDRERDKFKTYNFLNKNSQVIEAYNRIEVIYEDMAGVMWLGSPAGLIRFNPQTGTYKYYEFKPLSFILEDTHGTLWIGTLNGIYVFDRKKEQFTEPPFDFEFFKNPVYSITQIFEDDKENVWFGTNENGLYCLDRTRDTLIIYKNYINKQWGSGGSHVRDIFQSRDGIIWVATKFDGICSYNPASNSFSNYIIDEKFPSNSVYFIMEDTNGNLWLGCDMGLTKFDPVGKTFQNYDESYGLQSTSFEILANTTCHDGSMIIGGHNGFNIFDPLTIHPDTNCPDLILLSIRSQDKIIARDIVGQKSLKLKYWQNFLTFDFTQIDLINAKTAEYEYMLEGIDRQWVKSGNIGFVRYTNLKPGKYIFKVKANSHSPSCDNKPIKVFITIMSPVWETGWAYTIYLISLFLIFLGMYRISTMRARYKRQEEMTQMKLSFFTQISHEFRTPITLIIGSLRDLVKDDMILNEGKKKVNLLSRNVTRLNKLINQFLDFSAIEHGVRKMEVYNGNITGFIREIYNLFVDLGAKNGIQYTLSAEKEEYHAWFDPDKLEKMLTNLLSNAFKFTPLGGSISLVVSFPKMRRLKRMGHFRFKQSNYGNECIEITIVDTGYGMDDEQQKHLFEVFYSTKENNPAGTGIGLFYVKRIISLYGGEIRFKTALGMGTTFTVYLPVELRSFSGARKHEEELDIVNYFQNFDNPLLSGLDEEAAYSKDLKGKYTVGTGEAIRVEKSVILIVEDNDELREYLSGALDKSFIIFKAKDGNDGLKQSIKVNPDLIISDIMMPGMDGYALCERIKTNIQTSHIPVILLTAKTTLENKMEGYQTGADDYITKPFSLPLLIVRVNNLLGNRRKLREKFSRKLDFNIQEVTSNDLDKQFLDKLIKYVEKNIADKDISVEEIAADLNMERTTLYKKVKALVGKSPSQFINEIKVKNATRLLLSGEFNINQVADMVGFTSPSYFSSTFYKFYGRSPF